ncbi:hypothetical protein NQ318_000011 [Aromia moschata]|uniref:ZAD domain-containing protein n=1 Tax=Aromia moschata TaxID=1265417 RepID=A0AAV8YBC9_9CUCU|nr:hypothetical protein NQ318_000011 [Aromia moschata]
MEVICRFCLEVIEKPLPIDKTVKEIIGLLMLKLDLHITPEPAMCYGCAETLQTAFDFKSACIYTEDCLYPFIEGKSKVRLDLREIYLKVNDNEDVESVEGREVCRFCMKPSDSGCCTPLDVIEENVEIKKLLENYFPKWGFFEIQILRDLVMGVIEKPVACENCRSFLLQYSLFVTSFSHVELQIQSYAKTLGRDCVGEIDLRQVREFSLSNVTKREVETIANDKVIKEEVTIFNRIESEEQLILKEDMECEEIETGESKINMASPEPERREQNEFDSFARSDELFTLNQIPVSEDAHADVEMKLRPFLEPLETEVKGKYLAEDVTDIGKPKEKA